MPHRALADQAAAVDGLALDFISGPRDADGRFREEISTDCRADGAISWAQACGMAGGPFKARSSCVHGPEPR